MPVKKKSGNLFKAPRISQIIKGHNKKIEIHHTTTHPNKQCHSRDKESGLLQMKIPTKNVVYKATVKTNNSVKQYRCNGGKPKTKDICSQTFLF